MRQITNKTSVSVPVETAKKKKEKKKKRNSVLLLSGAVTDLVTLLYVHRDR